LLVLLYWWLRSPLITQFIEVLLFIRYWWGCFGGSWPSYFAASLRICVLFRLCRRLTKPSNTSACRWIGCPIIVVIKELGILLVWWEFVLLIKIHVATLSGVEVVLLA